MSFHRNASRRRRVTGLLAAAVMAVAGSTRAGTIRHDVADSQYTALAADPKYSAVGRLDWNTSGGAYMGSGTLLSSTWVLTAAHVVDNATASNMRLTLGGATYTATRWLSHASWNGDLKKGYDIGLVKLAVPVTSVTPAARFAGASELGMVGTSVGFGRTGTGLTGDTGGPGTRRAGTNVLDILGGDLTNGPPGQRYSDRIVLADFDHPSNATYNQPWSPSAAALPLEYCIAGGDSGGGLFVDVAGRARVAAVHSFGYGTDGTPNGTYGDVYGSTRVNQFNEWIDDTITNHWTNASGGAFAMAGSWSDNNVPLATDVVGFKTAGTYTVTLGGPTTSDRLLARGGNVTLNLAGSTYALTSTSAEGSLIVGKYGGNNATVSLTNGTLSSRDAVIAELPTSVGRVNVNAGAAWNAAGSVYVGGSQTGAGGTGTLAVAAGASASVAGTLHVWNAGTVTHAGGSLSAGQLTLATGGKLTVVAGGDRTLQVGGLSIASGASVDLADNRLVLDYDGTSPADQVRQYILNGRLTSTTPDPQDVLSLGYFDDAASLTVRLTYAGDANLDGVLDPDDYTLVDHGFAIGLTGWQNGDFDHSGSVTSADYLLIDRAFVLQGGPMSPEFFAERETQFGEAYVASLIAAVPEPGCLVYALAGMPAILGRRRATR